MRWKPIVVLWFALFLVAARAPAEPLRIVALEYPPYVFEEQGRPNGLAVKLIQVLFRNLGRDIDIQILPWGRSLQYMQTGQADAIFNLLLTEERQAYLLYVEEPLIEERISAYARRPLAFSGDLAALSGYSVSIARAFSYGSRIDAALQQGNFSEITTVNDYAATFALLARGRAEVIFSDERAAEYYKARLPRGDLISKIGPTLEQFGSYLAFSKKYADSDLPARVNREMIRLKASGEYVRLFDAVPYRSSP